MTKSINILCYDYPPNDGGISRLMGEVAAGLAAEGEAVVVCTTSRATHSASACQRPPLATVELPRKKGWRELALLVFLFFKSRRRRIVTSLWSPEAVVAWSLGFRRLYVLAHGNEVMPYPAGLKFGLKSWLRGRVLRAARCVVCNSRYTEGLVQQIDRRIRTAVINPGVDAARFAVPVTATEARTQLGLPEDKCLLLSVSRIDEYKGHDVVLDALTALSADQRARLHYVVAGKGGYLETLKQEAARRGLEDCITWLGFVSDAQLPYVYRAADLFVLCTREDKDKRGVEGFGMVFLEAQAAGVAVVGTRAGGIPDAIHESQGGWLIEQNDSAALARHLQVLIDYPQVVAEQGRRGEVRARNYCTWRHYVHDLQQVLEEYQ